MDCLEKIKSIKFIRKCIKGEGFPQKTSEIPTLNS